MNRGMSLIQSIKRLPLLRRIQWPPTIPVVRLVGAIGETGPLRRGLTLASVADALDRAFAIPDVPAVALQINSPGGSPVQSDLIARRIRQLADDKDVKVYAFCEDAAASGGYWLACAADEIYALDSSIVGSIGVVSAGFGFQDLIRRYGVERRVHASGERKVILDPFRDEDPEDVARLEALQAEVHDSFKDMVRVRRRGRLAADESVLFTGEFWSGKRAFELGLVDGIGEARTTLRGIHGRRTRLVSVPVSGSWLKRKLPAGGHIGDVATDWPGELLAAMEERALWQRLGL